MNLNYSLGKTLELLFSSIRNYSIMKIIIICSIILFILLSINKKYNKYIISAISLILFGLIIYFYHRTLISKDTFKYIMYNIRFYFLNSLLFLILINVSYYKIKNKVIMNSIYCISIILLGFSLFMTYYVNNIELITLGNIYPMIVFGNYLYFIWYLYLLITLLIFIFKRHNKH